MTTPDDTLQASLAQTRRNHGRLLAILGKERVEIGITEPLQRQLMTADELQRRNIEIRARLLEIDIDMLNDESVDDDEVDDLLEESDAIEEQLEEQFSMIGGGRIWVEAFMHEAAELGRYAASCYDRQTVGARPCPTSWMQRFEEAAASRSDMGAVWNRGVLGQVRSQYEERENCGRERSAKRRRKSQAPVKNIVEDFSWEIGCVWIRLRGESLPPAGPVNADIGSRRLVLECEGELYAFDANANEDESWGAQRPLGALHIVCAHGLAQVDTKVFVSSSLSTLLAVGVKLQRRVWKSVETRSVVRRALQTLLLCCQAGQCPLDMDESVFDDELDDGETLLADRSVASLYDAMLPPTPSPMISIPDDVQSCPSRYQLAAAYWMVQREQLVTEHPDPQYQRYMIAPPEGPADHIVFNTIRGAFAPSLQQVPVTFVPRGGILADQMGLGKTLECLLVIVANRRPESECGVLTTCADDGSVRESCATSLIVVPSNLLAQWRREIMKHCPSLRVVTYSPGPHAITASDMKESDIVLTTFGVLRQEVNYSRQVPYTLRQQKVHHIPTTPLLELEFARLICDEAQQLESSVASTALMALRIGAKSRWCVTGTPVGRHGLDDLRSLFVMIGYDPYTVRPVFNSLLQAPWDAGRAGPMLSTLRRVFWRNSKESVASELHLPSVSIRDVHLRFNSVEFEFYRRLLSETRCRVLNGQEQTDSGAVLSRHLEQLRQACCHPMRTADSLEAQTMSQISSRLYRIAEDEAAGAERELCRVLNRLGAFRLAQGLYRPAWDALCLSWYIAESGVEGPKPDALRPFRLLTSSAIVTVNTQHRVWRQVQIVNINLLKRAGNEVLVQSRQNAALSLNVEAGAEVNDRPDHEQLQTQALHSENKTTGCDDLSDHCTGIATATTKDDMAIGVLSNNITGDTIVKNQGSIEALDERDSQDLEESLKLISEQHVEYTSEFLEVALKRCQDLTNLIRDYTTRVYDVHMASCDQDAISIINKVRCLPDDPLPPTLMCKVANLERIHATARSQLDARLQVFDVWRRAREVDALIYLCQSHQGRLKQSVLLQIAPSASLPFKTMLTRESVTLRKLLAGAGDTLDDDVSVKLEEERIRVNSSLVVMKITKEIQKLRHRLVDAERQLQEYREVELDADSAIPTLPDDPEPVLTFFQTQIAEETARVNNASGHIRYLRYRFNDTANADVCAICLQHLSEPVVTVCYHTFCRACVRNSVNRNGGGRCPVCRHPLTASQLYVVRSNDDSSANGSNHQHDSQLHGMLSRPLTDAQQLSSKISAVVRSVLWACDQSPSVKVLVFSQFRPILALISSSLTQHQVRHRSLSALSQRQRSESIELFQDPASADIRALLVSLRSDASGLTLHSAQFVFIVEPSLNPAIEDQAISRVHRRGQTRDTFVFRYLIDESVEQKIVDVQRQRRLLYSSDASETNLKEDVSLPELIHCLDG
uniref:RING-type domain-containing protein n=1 Tax=Spongospora subterranea TaxID=70186 RepID=A0A0H5RN66_9EUKA|eukprot:CRZ10184.1 hypothetical protein [Spongospora subterranea]